MEDLGLLIDYFMEHYAAIQERSLPGLQPSVTDILYRHDWPGNVRELAHVIEGGLVISDEEFGVDELPSYLRLFGASGLGWGRATDVFSS